MAQSPVTTLPPGVELSVGGNGSTVTTPTGNLFHMLPLKAFHHLWTRIAPKGKEERNSVIDSSDSEMVLKK